MVPDLKGRLRIKRVVGEERTLEVQRERPGIAAMERILRRHPSQSMISMGVSPASIAIQPSDKFAYATNSGSNDVSMYCIGAPESLTLLRTIGTRRGKSRRRSSI